MDYDIKEPKLASKGQERIEWSAINMPVLAKIRGYFAKEKPLSGAKIACCLHVTAETANLMQTLKDGGAEVALCASNPLSTQDDVASALSIIHGIPTFAIKGEDNQVYYKHIDSVLSIAPNITIDDGADLISTIHKRKRELAGKVLGGCEETTTGVVRLRALEKKGELLYPVIAINDADTKHLFDNRYGTGQSTMDGIIRATNHLIAGSKFVVCGYGWCGKGVAMRARGLGAQVIVTEINPLKAIEAIMDGFQVLPIGEAAKIGDIFCTLTGCCKVISAAEFKLMKDGAVVCNSGHFDVELDLEALQKLSKEVRRLREVVTEYILEDGKRIFLLAEGRLVNLSAAEGHPAMVMDMSFANQALCASYLYKQEEKLEKRVYRVPKAIDETVARMKLESMNVTIDVLTQEQKTYLSSWELGT
jgi:adenosylhomocysteinase